MKTLKLLIITIILSSTSQSCKPETCLGEIIYQNGIKIL